MKRGYVCIDVSTVIYMYLELIKEGLINTFDVMKQQGNQDALMCTDGIYEFINSLECQVSVYSDAIEASLESYILDQTNEK